MSRMIKVDLEAAKDGVLIVQDIKDQLGRLLVKAPRVLDSGLKRTLVLRGIREILIQDATTHEASEWSLLLEKERDEIRRRFSRFPDTPETQRIVGLFIKAFEEFVKESERGILPS
ncbi:MAG: hypothetical protein ACYCYP_01435 [Leptospirales bacterium]